MASTSDRFFALLRSLAGSILNAGKAAPPRQTHRPGKAQQPKTRPGSKPSAKPGTAQSRPARPAARPASNIPAEGLAQPYPGDFHGTSTVSYSPKPDGAADPGEIVWTWVPYEEDHSQGKDRPVLVVGRNGRYLLALMMTSKDHSDDRRGDNDYVDIGTGPWDRQGRDSEVKLDRVLQVAPSDMRREGAVLDKSRFGMVATGLRRRHGWK